MDWAVFTTLCRAFSSEAADCDAADQGALHCGRIELTEELLWQVDSPQHSEEMKAVLGLFDKV